MGWWGNTFGGGAPGQTAQVNINGCSTGNALSQLLTAQDIEPGDEAGYETCKTILLYHPLGRKMTEAPVKMALAQGRQITVGNHPKEVAEAFEAEQQALGVIRHITNVKTLSRAYGVSTLVAGAEGVASNVPFDMKKIWQQSVYFNVLDPLNTAGSLVLSQVPGTPEFQRPMIVRTNGQTYHPSRFQVVMNEEPVYIAYTNSAFGYVGRSVYQRALFPLKTFVNSMVADDVIISKLAVFIAKLKQYASQATQLAASITGLKRDSIKQSRNANVVSIGHEDSVETIDMTHTDTAGRYARGNVLKNIATAADMPAVLLENETMVEGFGEGTEDAKVIAAYVEGVQRETDPNFQFTDNIVQYRAWNPQFFKRMQKLHPDEYGEMEYDEAFSEWRRAFKPEWPNLLREPPSELMKQEEVRLEGIINTLQLLLPALDPFNKVVLIRSSMSNITENKLLFPHGFEEIDYDLMLEWFDQQSTMQQEAHAASLASGADEDGDVGTAKKITKVDSASERRVSFTKARALLDELAAARQKRPRAA